MIVYPKDMTPEKKAYIDSLVAYQKREKERLWVIYNPDCGCKIDQFVALDRYPMSPKIIIQCPECKKGCLLLVSDPIVFHSKLLNEDYSLEDMKGMVFTDDESAHWVNQYLRHLD